MPPAGKTTVLLVDDHPILRRGLRQLLSAETDLEVFAEVGTAAQALSALEARRPDVAIVDIALGAADGLQLVRQISNRWPELAILVLSMHSEQLYAERSIRAGAHGYVMKDESPDRLLAALRRIAAGGAYISDDLQTEWLRTLRSGVRGALTPLESLTDRELAVFRLIGRGLGTREIARTLSLSVKTIETYRAQIKEKLAIRSATELVQRATLWLHRESHES